MKMELQIGGKTIIIEAEGAVSVCVLEAAEAARPACEQRKAQEVVSENMQGEAQGEAQMAATENVPEEAEVVPENMPDEAEAGASAEDEGLFARLSELRRGLAMAEKIPPYMVFKDTTLHEMAEKRPMDLTGLANISGVGSVKLDKYGGLFLAEIKGVAA